MVRNRLSVVIIALTLLCAMTGIVGAVGPEPQNISYQGKLTDNNGNPLNGAYPFTFRLYDVASGGSSLSTVSQQIQCTDGLFTTQLNFDYGVFDGRALWLGITVGDDSEMAPRQNLLPVPYAYNLVPSKTIRTISFPANSLNYNKSSPGILQFSSAGLRWSQDYQNSAGLVLERPYDWDGETDVVMHIYFYPVTTTSGNVDFFIRPRGYTPGVDTYSDAPSLDGAAVPVAGVNAIKQQMFSIPASSFGTKPLWFITIQNGGTDSTYPDDVIVMAVSFTYMAER